MMQGILIVDKPMDWTSFDVVAKLRGVLGTRKLGHSGTLDPMATGVLPVFCGGASKAVDLQLNHDKTYRATLRLGARTDTGDSTGTVLETAPVTAGEKELLAVLPQFIGPQMQVPPMYSAVKINGQPLYKLAREGMTVERKARPIEIYGIEYGGSPAENEYVLTVRCSKGTYIRTLLEEIAAEVLNYHGSGMSVMEMSHRSRVFQDILAEAEADLRTLMHIPENYKVLFVQGGGTVQFAMVPMNLMKNGVACYVETGAWSKKAIAEAKRYGEVKIVASSADQNFFYIPDCSDLDIPDNADYVYICANETINGTTYRPQVWTPQEANGVDLLVVALKYGALPGALDSIAAAVGPNTTVMSLMNGVDSEEIIAAKIGAEHVLPSLIKVASHKEADGYHFNPETTIGIIYGELAAPLKSERVQAVEALLAGTGIHSRVTPYIKEEIWSKFRLNVCNNLPQAILGAGVGCYQSSAHMKAISDGLCHELEAIAVAKGIDLSKVDASSRHGSLVPPATRYSTLQDLDAGRHTEIDMFSGALMRMGQELGIPTPYNEYTYHMIKALEEKNDGLFDYAAKASDLTCAK